MPVSGYKVSPERIAKISQQWIRDHIASMERHIKYLDERNKELTAQLELASGTHSERETNVRMICDDIEIALPPDAVITFQDRFQVSPTAHDRDSIDVIHAGNGAMVIFPVQDDEIAIREMRD